MSIRRIFSWFLWLPLAVLVILFVVANRGSVILSLDPAQDPESLLSLSMPLWAVFMLGLFLGFILGGFVVWLRQASNRKALRMTRQELDRLRKQVASDNHPDAPKDDAPANPFPMIGNI